MTISDSRLQLLGGNVRLAADDDATGGGKLINNGGGIAGRGVVTIEGTGNVLENRGGRISAGAGDLRIRSSTGSFAFDSESRLHALDFHSTLFLQAPLTGVYDGIVHANGGNEINFSEAFTLGDSGRITLHGTCCLPVNEDNNPARLFTPNFENQGGTIEMRNGIISAGTVAQSAGATLLIESDEPSSIIASTIDLSGNNTLNSAFTLDGNTLVRDDALVTGTGTLTFERGHAYRARSDTGLFFDVPVFNNGILTPGIPEDEIAMLDFRSLSLNDSSVLELEITGAALQDFDRIVSDTLSLDGVLDVSLGDDFVPNVGDRFHIMDAESMDGTFANVVGPFFNNSRFEVVYEASDVFLEVVPQDIIGVSFGDFNGDGALDAADIDQLTAAIGGSNMIFDLNSDGIVDNNDRSVLVEDLKNTFFGDANLDGQFDSGDFVAVFQRGQYEDAIIGNSGWADGDWNGDGDFDSGDFVLAFQSGGYESGQRSAVATNRVAAVPEPSSIVIAFLGCICLLNRRSLSDH